MGSLTDADVPDASFVGEAKLGFEGGQDFVLDLLDRVAAEGADLQGLAHLSVCAHGEQHPQLLSHNTHIDKTSGHSIDTDFQCEWRLKAAITTC